MSPRIVLDAGRSKSPHRRGLNGASSSWSCPAPTQAKRWLEWATRRVFVQGLVRFLLCGVAFLAVLLLDVWAVILLQPVGIVRSDLQNADRPSAVEGFGINGQSDKQVYGADRVGIPYLGMCVRVLSNCSAGIEPTLSRSSACASWRSTNFVVIGDVKFLDVSFNSYSRFARSNQLKESSGRFCPVVERRLLAFQSGDFPLQCGSNAESCMIQHFRGGKLSVGGVRNKFINIEPLIRTGIHSPCRPEETARLSYLASLSGRSCCPSKKTVGSNYHVIAVDNQNCLRSHSERVSSTQPGTQDGGWRYMRFGPGTMHESETGPQTGEDLLVLDREDIDVSRDARHWFHFAGANCLTRAARMPDVVPHSGTAGGPLKPGFGLGCSHVTDFVRRTKLDCPHAMGTHAFSA